MLSGCGSSSDREVFGGFQLSHQEVFALNLTHNITFEYDKFARLTKRTSTRLADEIEIEDYYRYDENSQLHERTVLDGRDTTANPELAMEIIEKETYEYTSAGPSGVISTITTTYISEEVIVSIFTHEGGKVQSKTTYIQGDILESREEYTYADKTNFLSEKLITNANGSTFKTTYVYGEQGYVKTINHSDGSRVEYEYKRVGTGEGVDQLQQEMTYNTDGVLIGSISYYYQDDAGCEYSIHVPGTAEYQLFHSLICLD